MSSEINISLPIASLEELRCYICKGYLSCSPVRLLPNGNCICGCCTPLITDAPIHRLVAFETLLSKLSFPCIFKKHRCTAMIPFGKTADHEFKCAYKAFACPASGFAACTWEGTIPMFFDHFNYKHRGFLKSQAEFKLDVKENSKGILMVVENSFAFIIKYFYKANGGNLKYDIRFCSVKIGHEASFKMQLVNDLDAERKVNLKKSECCPYDESFVDMKYAKVLNLNKCLENLDNPNCIMVAVKLKIIISDNLNHATESVGAVNLNVIELLKCHVCHDYLFPPLLEFAAADCCECPKISFNCKPSNNTELLKLNEAMYPCRWGGCDATLILSLAVTHSQSHIANNAVYVSGKVIYKTSFADGYPSKDIITIQNKRLIFIMHQMYNGPPYTHLVIVYTLSVDFGDVTGTIVFEHEHCKVKSKEFIVNSGHRLNVTIEELPHCFKEKDELTVTVKLIV